MRAARPATYPRGVRRSKTLCNARPGVATWSWGVDGLSDTSPGVCPADQPEGSSHETSPAARRLDGPSDRAHRRRRTGSGAGGKRTVVAARHLFHRVASVHAVDGLRRWPAAPPPTGPAARVRPLSVELPRVETPAVLDAAHHPCPGHPGPRDDRPDQRRLGDGGRRDVDSAVRRDRHLRALSVRGLLALPRSEVHGAEARRRARHPDGRLGRPHGIPGNAPRPASAARSSEPRRQHRRTRIARRARH